MMLELLLWAYMAGLVGSIFMDLTEMMMAKKGISSGVNINDIGRWFFAMTKGVFIHEDIKKLPEVKYEIMAGKVFHYILAGGGISLLYPIFLMVLNIPLEANHIVYGIIFGFLTNVFPWFWMMPSFGWGMFGLKKPTVSNTVLAPTVSHIAYGLGMGIALNVVY